MTLTCRGSRDAGPGCAVGWSPTHSSDPSPNQGGLAVGCTHRVEAPWKGISIVYQSGFILPNNQNAPGYLGEVESPWEQLTRCESSNRVRICQVQLKINLQYIIHRQFSQLQTLFPPYLQRGKPFLCLWRLRPKLECKVHGLCQRSRTEAEKQNSQ